MRVELLVSLKVSNGTIIPAHTIYSDEEGQAIPDFITRRLTRGMAKILSNRPQIAVKPKLGLVKETVPKPNLQAPPINPPVHKEDGYPLPDLGQRKPYVSGVETENGAEKKDSAKKVVSKVSKVGGAHGHGSGYSR